MRIRLFVEAEVDDAALLTSFGERLPMIVAAHEIEAGLCRQVETVVSQFGPIKEIKVVYIPQLLKGL